jgi:hypothetical protein
MEKKLSSKQKFLLYPNQDPKTGENIKIGGKQYKQLEEKYGTPKIKSPKTESKIGVGKGEYKKLIKEGYTEQQLLYGNIHEVKKSETIPDKTPEIPENPNYTSAKQILSTILLNSDTSKILDDYIVSYMKMNPHLVTEYLNENGLYHVYFRKRDTDTDPDIGHDNDMILIKSFVTLKDAEEWVLMNGREHVEEQQENYEEAIVLTIVYDDNKGKFAAGDNAAHSYGISTKKYPTYAFTKDGYNMLKDELKYNRINIKNSKWIHYIQ